ncbi:MAG: ATP-binding protein [Actinobacteria bacterium]|nr:ATP-binding protein [Actinomycetota bacterium]
MSTTDPPTGAAFHVHDLEDVLVHRALASFAAGELPWAREVQIDRVADGASLCPPGSAAARTATESTVTTTLHEGEGWLLVVRRYESGSARLLALAVDEEVGGRLVAEATEGAVATTDPDDATVELGFWYQDDGANRRTSPVDTPRWADIRGNYGSEVRTALDRLMTVTPESLSGRIVLLHGPPGTGKTTALRSLAHAWRGWCQVDYVIDPDRLLGMASYLMAAALRRTPYDDRDWRLLLLEDCDELIRTDAKAGTGQALARLLNLTDGLLGQGLHLLFAITTNEPLASLHPAISRPGRCLAEIEVGPLTTSEAREWWGDAPGTPVRGATLAELVARREATDVVAAHPAPVAVGQYL